MRDPLFYYRCIEIWCNYIGVHRQDLSKFYCCNFRTEKYGRLKATNRLDNSFCIYQLWLFFRPVSRPKWFKKSAPKISVVISAMWTVWKISADLNSCRGIFGRPFEEASVISANFTAFLRFASMSLSPCCTSLLFSACNLTISPLGDIVKLKLENCVVWCDRH